MKHAEDFEIEPIVGLPGLPPHGERVLWQGRPQWKSLTRYAFRMRWLAAYFGVVVLVSAATGATLSRLASMTAVFAACLGLCALIAWLQARSTVYTITSHRVVMRIGVALPVTWNFPFARLESADAHRHADSTGDIALRLVAPDRVAWFHLWPHARPGRRLRARPTLRAVAEPAKVAARLEQAVRTWADDTNTEVTFDARLPTHERAVAVSPPSPPPPAPDMSTHGHHHEQKIPRGVLIGAGALLAATLALAAAARHSSDPRPSAPIQVAIELRFDDRPDGAVVIVDASSGETVSIVPPEHGGFIRGVMRGMVRTRKLESIDLDEPFRLVRHADGALIVEDPSSGHRVDLRSFGHTNHAAFAQLLPPSDGGNAG